MLAIYQTKTFRKSLKKAQRRQGFSEDELADVIDKIRKRQALEVRYSDHPLKGTFIGHRECHLSFGLLLIYKVHEDLQVLSLTDIDTHPKLFGR